MVPLVAQLISTGYSLSKNEERGRPVRQIKPFFRLQTTITILVCVVVALALLVTDILSSQEIGRTIKSDQADKAMTVARMMAHSPIIIDGLQQKDAQPEIEPYTNQMTKATHVEFIVVLDMNGIRKSHPNPAKIGKHFVGGDEGPVLHGQEHISTAKGTLGYSLRAFSPVYARDGHQIGAVAVGISLNIVKKDIKNNQNVIFVAVIFGLLIGTIGAIILARKIKKSMFGLEPVEIGKLLEERSAMLQSTKEGILAIDQDARITLMNNEALRLFKEAGIKDNPIGKLVDDVIPHSPIRQVLETGQPRLNQEVDLSGMTLIANQLPIIVGDNRVGTITTFRNKSEINQLAEELTGVKLYAEALRAQSHEFMNKLHVILGLVQLEQYEKLADYIDQISDHLQNEVGYISSKLKDPALAGFILGKMSYARELGADLDFTGEGVLPEPRFPEVTHELISILGNLIDNALDVLKNQENKTVSVHFYYGEQALYIEVADNGLGIEESAINHIFLKGFSTKGKDRGIGLYLVKHSLARLRGQLAFSTEVGKGTRFSLTIPYEIKG